MKTKKILSKSDLESIKTGLVSLKCTKEQRVYCCNCDNFVRAVFDDYMAWDDYCRAKTGRVIEDNISGDYPERFHIKVGNLNYPNRDGKCKLYVKKWWKWWVK